MSRLFLSIVLAAGPALAAQALCPCPTGVRRSRSSAVHTGRRTPRTTTTTTAVNEANRSVTERETRTEELRTFTLAAGTPIPVRLEQPLDTRYDHAGAPFVARVSRPIAIGGDVVVPRGAICRGHLAESKPSGRLKGRPVMWLNLDTIETRGRIYHVATTGTEFAGKGHKKRNAAWIGGGTATGAGIGAIAGDGIGAAIGAGAGAVAGTTGALITGKRNLHLATETPMTFTLRRPIVVHERVLTASR